MAEAVVNLLVLKIRCFLVEESWLLAAVRENIEDILKEFERLRSFVRDAERRSESDVAVAIWLKQLQEVAYDMDDIMDEYTYFMAEQKTRGFRNCFAKALRINPFRGVTIRLKHMKSMTQDVSERSSRYGFDYPWSFNVVRERPVDTSRFVRVDTDVVGMESNKQVLISWLTDEAEELMKICVCGMGGIGKTTLVAQVYRSLEAKIHFDFQVWLTVSQTYSIAEVLKSLASEILINKDNVLKHMNTMDTRILLEMLRQNLLKKRYLIVLDDVWDTSVWEEIRFAFPEDKCRSRIVFTTRNSGIATLLASSHCVFEVKPLQCDEAWALFCNIAFRGNSECSCPPEFEDLARAIVNKCHGLPLAIVNLAGLMKKHSRIELNRVLNSINGMLTNVLDTPVIDILMLSFHELPYHLKNCFLYCGAFPESYKIKRKRIVRLWVAEGFVEEREGMTTEEVAEEYLNELINRSMLQVTKADDGGKIKECCMHDLMRDMAISISKKQNFFIMCEGHEEQLTAAARRLSIIEVSDSIKARFGRISHIRSFLVFSTDARTLNQLVALRFRLLRVLDLYRAPVESLPNAVCNLFNLRYLSIRRTKVNVLPKNFGRLQKLQTLDLQYSRVKELPRMTELLDLRHLFIIRSVDEIGLSVGMRTPGKIWALKDLQTLEGIVSNNKVVQQVQNLKRLRSFVILEVKMFDGEALCASIEKMRFLNNLQVQAMEGEGLELESLASPPSQLQKLFLIGHLQRLPRWFSVLNSLKVLRLRSSWLNEDPLRSLQSLPVLVCLELHKAYEGEKLWCEVGGFPSLITLRLIELSQLNQITIEEGAMMSLRELQLSRCRELNTLPQGIESLTILQKLSLEEMPEELLQRMRPNGAEYHKIRHIPTIDRTPIDDLI
ncbi:Disease resistance protein RPM1 [Acorus calamus]|uniref:Disease resistance protein RPM1 n=1 Tax=Acorus calamus TaxID=4465 RepID=A0AAV9CW02_ACOCL|nr:Disease resistance protein RPM1 [Acorus calamus]